MKYASTKQMSCLRKLYHKCPVMAYESWDTFDDINIELVSQDDAQILIDRKQRDPELKEEMFRQEVTQIINKIEGKI